MIDISPINIYIFTPSKKTEIKRFGYVAYPQKALSKISRDRSKLRWLAWIGLKLRGDLD